MKRVIVLSLGIVILAGCGRVSPTRSFEERFASVGARIDAFVDDDTDPVPALLSRLSVSTEGNRYLLSFGLRDESLNFIAAAGSLEVAIVPVADEGERRGVTEDAWRLARQLDRRHTMLFQVRRIIKSDFADDDLGRPMYHQILTPDDFDIPDGLFTSRVTIDELHGWEARLFVRFAAGAIELSDDVPIRL